MFEWYKKIKLAEQLKFFGAKKQKFISVYAKKPRIRVEVKSEKRYRIDLNKLRHEALRHEAHRAEMVAQATLAHKSSRLAQANITPQSSINIQGVAYGNSLGLGGYSGLDIGIESQFSPGNMRRQAQAQLMGIF